jgi:hypothetical protein
MATLSWLDILAGGSGGIVPTGTGVPKIVGGVQQAAAALVVDADVSATAAIAVAKLAPSGTNGQVLTTTAGVAVWAAAGGGGGTPWHNVPRATKTANYTITAADYLIVCRTNTGFSITLPASPSDGDTYAIKNGASVAGNNYVGGNGRNIDGYGGGYTLTPGASVTVTYDGTTAEWVVQ